MLKLRTEIDISDFKQKFGYTTKAILIGSCFSENIGEKLRERCLPVNMNPFGIVYNPISIANSLNILIQQKVFTEKDIFFSNGLWNSFYHHSRFSHPVKEECLKNINKEIDAASRHLRQSKFLFITFGTSWSYRNKKSQEIVSNCHKIPASHFNQELLSHKDICSRWEKLLKALLKLNPELHIVFTVSPVRHLKDGAHRNQVSKSILLIAIDELIKSAPSHISYFPSYELVMDELRDYRFYSEDMIHLNKTAINFIWEKFSNVLFAEESKNIMKEIMKLRQSLHHKPFNPKSPEHQKHIQESILKAKKLLAKHPFINIKEIINDFHNKIDC